ncbi:MAG: ABC transporter ATP-binding protein, partial [Ktedonobacteraceae bacterium]
MNEERRKRKPVEAGGIGPMGKGGMGAMGKPVQKAKNFKVTFKRLLHYFMPQKYRLLIVFGAAILGTIFSILAPKILGLATTKLFDGLIAKFRHVPGAGIDFGFIGEILLILLGLYSISALSLFIQQYVMVSVAQR